VFADIWSFAVLDCKEDYAENTGFPTSDSHKSILFSESTAGSPVDSVSPRRTRPWQNQPLDSTLIIHGGTSKWHEWLLRPDRWKGVIRVPACGNKNPPVTSCSPAV